MIAIYARVSTTEQAKEGYSIGEQIDRMRNYCKAMGWENVQEYVDAGFSGASIDRPSLARLIKDIEQKKIQKVVVLKLDRLSRSQLDTLYMIEKVFYPNGVDFVSMSENFGTGSPFGKASIGIMSAFAQLEREQIKERMQMGRKGRSKEGLYHGGSTKPTGYDYVDGRLIVNEFEAMQVREIFRLFLLGGSYKGIARELNERGLTKKNSLWYDTSVHYVLKNPLYIGKVTFDGELFDGIHEPIISEEDFYAVQKRESSLRESRLSHGRKNHTYLGGLLRCGKCGHRYTSHKSTKGNKTYLYYSCSSHSVQGAKPVQKCDNKTYKQEELNGLIFAEVKKLSMDEDYLNSVAKTEIRDDFATLQAELKNLQNQKDRIFDLYSMSYITAEELQKRISPITQRIDRLSNELELSVESSMNKKEVSRKAVTFGDVLDNGTIEEARAILQSLIKEIVIDGEDITIYWNFC